MFTKRIIIQSIVSHRYPLSQHKLVQEVGRLIRQQVLYKHMPVNLMKIEYIWMSIGQTKNITTRMQIDKTEISILKPMPSNKRKARYTRTPI